MNDASLCSALNPAAEICSKEAKSIDARRSKKNLKPDQHPLTPRRADSSNLPRSFRVKVPTSVSGLVCLHSIEHFLLEGTFAAILAQQPALVKE